MYELTFVLMTTHLFVGTSIAAAWKLGFLNPEDSGAGLRVAGDCWEGTGGMGAGELAAVKERHAELARLQGELRAQEAAMNALQVQPFLLSTNTSPSPHFPPTILYHFLIPPPSVDWNKSTQILDGNLGNRPTLPR
jgi:hypothetical protein